MSLEFRLSELITVIELATRLRKHFIRAPREFDSISRELRGLSFILQDVEIDFSEGETDEQQKAHLQEIVGGCRNALLDLEKDVGNYSELESVGHDIKGKVKRVWTRAKWDPNDIRDVRDRLISNTTLLSAYLNGISSQTIISAKKGIDRLNLQQDNQDRLAILDWLTPLDYAPLQSDLMNQKQVGTGQWLLDAPEFQTWLSAKNGTLFCPGIPGAGKTMLSAMVIDNISTRFTDDDTMTIACADVLRKPLTESAIFSSDGMFLLAKLHLESLVAKSTPRAIRVAIAKLPSGSDAYNESYHNLMVRIEGQLDDHQRLAKEVLSWITCAKRQLSITELQHALAVELGEHEFDEENTPQPEDMLSVCVGLVKLDETTDLIGMVHYTAQEFFERTQQRWFPDADSRNTRVCITYLSYTVFENGLCPTDTDFEERLRSNPFYNYAAQNWGHHARKALCLQDISDFLGSSGLIEAASQALLAAQPWPRCSDYSQRVPRQVTGLHLAAHFGIDKVVEALLQNGVDADARDDTGRTPLSWAASNGHAIVVRSLLMEDGVDINSQDQNGQTPLSWAAKRGHEAVVKLLRGITDMSEAGSFRLGSSITRSSAAAGKKANLILADKIGRTPLHRASEKGHIGVVKLLLGHRTHAISANSGTTEEDATDEINAINICDADFKTPLHYAALHSRAACVQLLLRRGATITADIDNMTALHYTVSNPSETTARCMLDAGVLISTGVKRDQSSELDSGDNARYVPRKTSQPVVDCCIHRGLTALHYAALIGCDRMTKFFLLQGADPNVRSEYHETPLHLAIKRDLCGPIWPTSPDRWNDPVYRIEESLDIIGYGPDDAAEYGETKNLVEQHRLAVVTLLLGEDSAEVNAKDVYGNFPLHCVKFETDEVPNFITLLIENGADVSARNNRGETALHLACSKGSLCSVTLLLDRGADITAVDFNGLNSIHFAAQSQNVELLEHLLPLCPATLVAARDICGRNALHHLGQHAWYADEKIIEPLICAGVSVTDVDHEGFSPLALYLRTFLPLDVGAAEVVRLFFRYGSDPFFQTPQTRLTLAHLYAKSTCEINFQVIQALREFGVDLKATDSDGRTLLHHCAKAGSLTDEAFHFLRDNLGMDEHLQDHRGKVPLNYAMEERRKKRDPFMYDPDRWSRTERILLGAPK
ncbi:hypothetical protein PWT90_05426 [Aphanocladium album]|nr:hypothetical protein PWT90_05426 [Aphanocladium album]